MDGVVWSLLRVMYVSPVKNSLIFNLQHKHTPITIGRHFCNVGYAHYILQVNRPSAELHAVLLTNKLMFLLKSRTFIIRRGLSMMSSEGMQAWAGQQKQYCISNRFSTLYNLVNVVVSSRKYFSLLILHFQSVWLAGSLVTQSLTRLHDGHHPYYTLYYDP